jgi:hypothetical protein
MYIPRFPGYISPRHHLRGLISCGLLMLVLNGTGSAQKGTAPNGYYPAGYNGATFTGSVVQTTDDTITLNYVHGSKTDTFEAYAAAPCNLPSSKTTTQPMPLSKVQTGAVVTLFYEPKETKVDGKKQKKNQVIGILFLEENGRKIKEEHQAIFYCVAGASNFMAFQQ